MNSYWKSFQSVSKEITYEFEHNALRIEKDYVDVLKRLQEENEELKRDKEHRWRNMFMVIKDNRVHRKRNQKLTKSIYEELERSRCISEQMLIHQIEN